MELAMNGVAPSSVFFFFVSLSCAHVLTGSFSPPPSLSHQPTLPPFRSLFPSVLSFHFSPLLSPLSLSVSLCLSDSFISACRCPYDCLFPCISFSISVLVSFSQQLHLFASMSSIPLVIVPHLKAPASDPTSSKLSASISMPFACQHVVCMPACCLHGFFCVTICMMVFVGLS